MEEEESIERAMEASMDDFREAEALARAMEASLQEQLALESLRLARELHRSELHAADQELARALDSSLQHIVSEALSDAMTQNKRQRTEERNEGSWDCPRCTFTNRPYRHKCHGCEANAPAHVLVFSKMASTIRFGLEIEMFIPQGRNDGFTNESIAESLTNIGPPSVEFRGYSHETSECWKIVTDSSIGAHDCDLCFELVSPILQGETGLVSLRSVMDNVRRLGIATNSSCGFHVHVDAESSSCEIGTLVGLQRISQSFCSVENAFDLLVDLTWTTVENRRRANQNKFCRSNRLAFGEQSNRQRWERISSTRTKAELVNMVNPGNDRYRKLNLTNICNPSRPSTCEFRHHGGVEDLREAEAWVRLIVSFCQGAARLSVPLILPEDAPPKSELRALFDIVNDEGLEQFFVVERRLFAVHRLCNEWKCQVCHRRFASSRALSQHAAACGH